jgi:hypothetical protein
MDEYSNLGAPRIIAIVRLFSLLYSLVPAIPSIAESSATATLVTNWVSSLNPGAAGRRYSGQSEPGGHRVGTTYPSSLL